MHWHFWRKSSERSSGDTENPLLVSVRSGARASMPGMMDTILNLGLTDISVEGFAKRTGNPRFAYDSYRRFIQMFSDVVMEVPKSLFERVIDEIKEDRKVHFDTELTAEDLKEVIRRFKEIYKGKNGRRISAGAAGSADGSGKGGIPFGGIMKELSYTEE